MLLSYEASDEGYKWCMLSADDYLQVPTCKFRAPHMLLSVGVLTLALTAVSQHAASVEVKTPKVALPKVTVKPPAPNHPKSHTPRVFFDNGGSQPLINRTINVKPSAPSNGTSKAATDKAPNNAIAPPNNAGTGGGIFTGTGAGSGNLIAPNLIAAPPNNAIAPPNNAGTGGGIFTGTGAGSGNLIAPNLAAPPNNAIAPPNNAGTGGGIFTGAGAGSGNPIAAPPNIAGASSVTPQKFPLPPK
jgi:hypothetical protein